MGDPTVKGMWNKKLSETLIYLLTSKWKISEQLKDGQKEVDKEWTLAL